MKSSMDGNFNAIIVCLDRLTDEEYLPLPLNHLASHPELIDNDIVKKLQDTADNAHLLLSVLPEMLTGVGELMCMVEMQEDEEPDIFIEDVQCRIKRVGGLVNLLAGLIHSSVENEGNAKWAIHEYERYQGGKYHPHTCSTCGEMSGKPPLEAA